ncbi:conserved hypothetical protein [Talaromyces stipitatus ATCC 10500]|uniref:Integrase catalytic domain-containing protein n=1 Tax=Talaromyces stipitatus (strain ATCC 10500 / CBS 375.48 / QM 6759 / NRRL 1006) TaxID=441959 RepID=B8LV21_TALSN|nr:uncharacterized protein TSTA_061320 [Talaromyces stipitatus ATCC 10500]EED22642.1 conserved hypothetical protein [Talaromyces stipitatus ATCC 10500]
MAPNTNPNEFDPEGKNRTQRDTYVEGKLKEYKEAEDVVLWAIFKQDFEKWSLDHLRQTSFLLLSKLITLLKSNGVYVDDTKGYLIAENVATAAAQREPHEWTETEVIAHLRKGRTFESSDINTRFTSVIAANTQPQRIVATTPEPESHLRTVPDTPTPYQRAHTGVVTRSRSDLDPALSSNAAPETPYQATRFLTPFTPALASRTTAGTTAQLHGIPELQEQQNINTQSLRPQPQYTAVQAIINIGKSYNGASELKYKGSGDSFKRKLKIFYGYCRQNGLPNTPESYREALPHMLRDAALSYYWDNIDLWIVQGKDPAEEIIARFEGPEHQRSIKTEWSATTLASTIQANPEKSVYECLNSMLVQLQDLFYCLPDELQTQTYWHMKLLEATSTHPACDWATAKPAPTVPGLIQDLQSNVRQYERKQQSNVHGINFTDRRYNTRQPSRSPHRGRSSYGQGRSRERSNSRYPSRSPRRYSRDHAPQVCHVCKKPGCWSTEHTEEERRATRKPYEAVIDQYIVQKEGKKDTSKSFESYLTEIDKPSQYNLPDREKHLTVPEYAFLTEDRYSSNTFMGLLIDTGAAEISTAGYAQYLAYRKVAKNITIDTSTTGAASIRFGAGEPLQSLGSIDIKTPIGTVRFHIVEAMTPFLLCIKDLDRLKVYYDNTKDLLVRDEPYMTAPVVQRFGHPFLIWDYSLVSYIIQSFDEDQCFLTAAELRRLHRRFGHPSVGRLHKTLLRAGYDANPKVIERINKFCHHCQTYGKSPGRFRFTLRDEVEFNHSIIVDIMYINGKPVLHIVDEATRFNAACWLTSISAKATWDALQMLWIDMYLGPPDFIVTDAGKNFVSKEFTQLASSVSTITVNVPVEAHWSIGVVERYHAVLRRSYEIISEEVPELAPEMALQMAVKAVNDTAGPDGYVPTLLVFGAYPRITDYSPPASTVVQRAAAVKKAMTEVRRLHTVRQVNNALNTRNGPSSTLVHRLPLNSDVLVWREGGTGYPGKWKGPYKLISIDGETCTVELPNGPTKFRSTVVKPYYKDDDSEHKDDEQPAPEEAPPTAPLNAPTPTPQVATPPSKPNNAKAQPSRPQREHRLPSRYRDDLTYLQEIDNTCLKEIADIFTQLVQLTGDGQFDESRRKEVTGLLERGVFMAVNREDIPPDARIYGFRFVDEVKNKGTNKAFEKSRLVVQAYNDKDKEFVLTQSPTIQRSSQRLILCIGISKDRVWFWIRDVTQAYIQSTTKLNREFYIQIPPELRHFFPGCEFLKVVQPLYGIPEAGNHWFHTYHKHHTKQLGMETSTYDPCLLHCCDPEQGFGVIGMQTDDTLIVADEAFAAREEEQIKRANILCKPREQLTTGKSLRFNGAVITENAQGITLTQERTCKNIRLVQDHPSDTVSSRGKVRKNASPHEQYIAQRALGAYIASVSQPEASFDLSFAAQATQPGKEDIKALNKRLQWQIDNSTRGLRFVKIDLRTAKLYAFVDASFANNKDSSSQIGHVIVLADARNNANILHWSSTKCKRITRSVLASEMYGMANGFDAAAAIKSTLTQLLHLSEPLPLVLCTDSKSLYECLVKLGTTREKRLMIDLMCLRQSYERQEITEVRWINGNSNPADAMTKSKPCRALQELIDTNKLRIDVDGWVERPSTKRTSESKNVRFATPVATPAP